MKWAKASGDSEVCPSSPPFESLALFEWLASLESPSSSMSGRCVTLTACSVALAVAVAVAAAVAATRATLRLPLCFCYLEPHFSSFWASIFGVASIVEILARAHTHTK